MGKAQNLLASSKDTLNSVTNLPLDTIILITIFIILLVYSLRYGKYKIISILYSQIIFFLIIVVFFNIIIRKFILEEFLARGFRQFIESGFLAVVGSGLLFAISYHIIPITLIYDFAAPIDALFSSTRMLFWWLAIPFIVLLFTVKKR